MAKAKEEKCSCKMGTCPKCMHGKILILGALILLNASYGWFSWAVFIGCILVLKGLIGMIMPKCPHCE